MLKPAAVAMFAVLVPVASFGQEAGGYSVGPKETPDYETTVKAPRESPEPSQQRLFAGTRFWRLDQGRYEVEIWWRARHNRDGSQEHLLQAEIEIGLTSHIQLDLYENVQYLPDQGWRHEGNQIEMRFSLAKRYGEIFANPTIYLEWHPRHNAPDRAEGRLLLGGEVASHLVAAVNLFYEQNVETSTSEGSDAEVGAQLAASYGLANDSVRLGGEIKVGGDQHGGSQYQPVLEIGPNLLLRSGPFKLTATMFFGLLSNDPRFEPFVIAGYAF